MATLSFRLFVFQFWRKTYFFFVFLQIWRYRCIPSFNEKPCINLGPDALSNVRLSANFLQPFFPSPRAKSANAPRSWSRRVSLARRLRERSFITTNMPNQAGVPQKVNYDIVLIRLFLLFTWCARKESQIWEWKWLEIPKSNSYWISYLYSQVPKSTYKFSRLISIHFLKRLCLDNLLIDHFFKLS